MALMSCAEAACGALARSMREDERVVALGEDLGRGGVFGQYRGLAEEFGAGRVIDAPISESAIMGAAVGMALAGLRPVVEMRVADFALCAIDELVNQAAKNRYMFGGQGRVPLVARLPIGIWSASAAQHSQSIEAWFAHTPGLVVVAPSSPADTWGLLRAAIACDDPVVFHEHKELWGVRGEVGEDAVARLGEAKRLRAGGDLTLVSWSRTVHEALEAADAAAASGVSVEVIDLRTIWPWDREAVLESCARTGRLMVVHEAVQACGFGAEIAATVAEEVGIPVTRLGAPRIPAGYAAVLEDEVRIGSRRILGALLDWVDGRGRRRSSAATD
ncbi:MAG: alpha-ketoacid dehydrogenase subunit beta [Rhodocyclaceae bacterium]